MQYTGLKDKNGKKIYEGDILQHPLRKVRVIYTEAVSMFQWEALDYSCWSPLHIGIREVEVLGNIYENPELLK